MPDSLIQSSFSGGEWAPALYARVDLAKYKTGAALMKNFYVDFHGGASTRPGTRHILQAFDSSHEVRLIPFQASYDVGYVIEVGHEYMRFYNNGVPILEGGIAITGISKAAIASVTAANTYVIGDIVYIKSVLGMTQINNEYYRVVSRTAASFTIEYLNGTNVNSTAFGTYTSGGTAQRVYKISTPYNTLDLPLLKYAQKVSEMIITHTKYKPRLLRLNSAADWALTEYQIGTTITAPTGLVVTQTGGAAINSDVPLSTSYRYAVTAVDEFGQESQPSFIDLLSKLDMTRSQVTNVITWAAVSGATSYNVYKTVQSHLGAVAVPAGSPFGFIGNATQLALNDTNIPPDFALSIPITFNPFLGSSVTSVSVGAGGSYTVRPAVFFSPPGAGGITATGTTTMVVLTATVANDGIQYDVGDLLTLQNGVVLRVTIVDTGDGSIDAVSIISPGSFSGTLPANPVSIISSTGSGGGATFTLTWKVSEVVLAGGGAGYAAPPTVTFSSGTATATATIGSASSGNPSVPAYCQQRLFLGGLTKSLASFHFSQTGAYNNFDYSLPLQASDSISGTLVANQLQQIQHAVPIQSGLLTFTNQAAWLLNGGSRGSDINPIDISAHPQSYIGIDAFCQPIVVNFDILFVQAKGSVVRDLAYNFYTNIFTGTDITVTASHLLNHRTIREWAWAEEPHKILWCVRDDGALLSLTFMKEQELIGWAQHDTQGDFKSVTTITESVDGVLVDAVYFVSSHVVDGLSLKYISRMVQRDLSEGRSKAWCVDQGVQYSGAPATSFRGASHLGGLPCAGLADGEPFTVTPSLSGTFTLATPASVVTVGLAYVPELQTLRLDDTKDPTLQAKDKKISIVTLRVEDALGLEIGSTFTDLVLVRDLVVGNVGSATNEEVTDLVTGDCVTIIDPKWSVHGQFCVRQPVPYPATILGIVPEYSAEKRK